ncbi:hypothetical protein MIN45_P0690 [Methylomarinovum tepidoasis]|uniref:YqcC-like domain-containing protein n=1 Tax=Methylomarinovum tepidoasis TaxID=2840183 RepID=A0AAU9CC42_9GAMM|nr:YqcC family protein [Methylomarinovum sp. IN45]BCX88321.1 hypothetical protein MIN45_P0690 [Methylomarinovum sp. IN45]
MSDPERIDRAADLLLELEAELRRLGLWEEARPSDEALASPLPFCCDTLSFPQWLQFVFLERMKPLIEAGGPLPGQCGIAPMAEEWFAGSGIESKRLLRLLRDFDELLTQD